MKKQNVSPKKKKSESQVLHKTTITEKTPKNGRSSKQIKTRRSNKNIRKIKKKKRIKKAQKKAANQILGTTKKDRKDREKARKQYGKMD